MHVEQLTELSCLSANLGSVIYYNIHRRNHGRTKYSVGGKLLGITSNFNNYGDYQFQIILVAKYHVGNNNENFHHMQEHCICT